MRMIFKPGDRVRRVRIPASGQPIGFEGTVSRWAGERVPPMLALDGVPGWFFTSCYELVQEAGTIAPQDVRPGSISHPPPWLIPTWDAAQEIDGGHYVVVLTRDGKPVAALAPDVALSLADALTDAAGEPARCMRDGCGQYALVGDLCPEHYDAAPRWTP